jgi:hypothetical protein
MNHIELDRLFELAEVSAIVDDQPERDHIRSCDGCSAAFLQLRDIFFDGDGRLDRDFVNAIRRTAVMTNDLTRKYAG